MDVLNDRVLRDIENLAQIAARAERIVVLTGAGVSAESGVPTFRDAQTGLWEKHDPVMLASIEGFRRDPAMVWKWYDERRGNISKVEPNPGHYALAEWETTWREKNRAFKMVTQNIDDLHRKAGSQDMVELHGNIWYVRPLEGAMHEAFRLDECPLESHPPYDSRGRMLRPHVVWFGELLDPNIIDIAFHAVANCDLMFSVGTSTMVYPAAALPFAALRSGATVVEVNPNPTELTGVADWSLSGPSGVMLPALWEAVKKHL